MKVKTTRKKVLFYTFFYMLLFGMSYSGFSQCPTVNNPSPSPICDASGYTFQDLNTFATDGGNGIVWYDALTGGSPYNPNQLLKEGVYYADDNTGICGSRASITIDFILGSSSQNLDRIYCSNENSTIQTYIDDVLQSIIPIGGSVEIYNDIDLTSQVDPIVSIPLGATNYYIVFVDNGGCKSQVEIGSTALFDAPSDPIPETPQAFCSEDSPTVGDLDPGTTETNFSWYANVDVSGNPILPALSLLTALVDGNSYYIQINDVFCESNAIEVVVNIDDPVNAGTPGSLEYCDNSLPLNDINLFDQLGAPKDATGSWSGPLTTSNGNLGTVNISSLTTVGAYTFTYTVPSNGVCPEDVSTLTISVYETFSSGNQSANNPALFCESSLPTTFDLFTLLENNDLGGQWTGGNSIIDLTGFTAGTYNYTYTQNALPNPCPEETTTVQVTVLQDPDAGNALNDVFCENDLASNSPYNLFNALDNTQDNNSGTWTDSSNTPISNSLNINSLTVDGSPYTFNYTIDNGTCSDTEAITLTIELAPESGTVNTPAAFCEGTASATYDLFELLAGEDQTGTWYIGNDNTGTATANLVDLSTLTANTYNYTYDVDVIGSCDDQLVTVQVIINPLPNTGTANNPAPFCENDSALNNTSFNLLTLLTGTVDSGGTWTDDSATAIAGVLSGNTLNLSQLVVDTYTFTYTITDANTCTNSTAVTISIVDAPESGTVNTPAAFCEGTASATYDLFELLAGEDQTGTWYIGNDNTGIATANLVDLSTLTANTYNYTYDVDAIGSCDDQLVTVQVIINPLPNTGTANNPAPFCENDSALNNTSFDLLTLLTGTVDSGGTWTDDSATAIAGVLSGNTLDLSQLVVDTYTFTYTITDANTCTNSTAVTISIVDAPESGTVNTPAAFCEGTASATYDLFELLAGEDQTGTWYIGNDNTGTATANLVDLSTLTANTYNYTYDVDVIGSCDDQLVTVQVIINPLPNTGTANNPAPFCENDSALNNTSFDLLTLLTGTVDSGGTWTDDSATAIAGVLSGNTLNLSQLVVDTYTFTYTITDANTCTNSTAVTISIVDAPESGTANTPVEFCIAEVTSGQTYNLFDLLTDEDQTGTWSDDSASGTLSANIVTLDGLMVGTYNFTFNVDAIGSCDDVNVTVSIIINDTPAPTTLTPQEFCDTATISNLVAIGTSIKWYDAATGGNLLADTTALVDAQMYYATQTDAITGCESSVRTAVTATIYQSPDAGAPNATTIVSCNDNTNIDLFTGLDGTQDAGGTWQNNDGAGSLSGNVLDVTGVSAGTYTYTYLVTASAPCLDDNETITITIEEPLNAGSTINPTLDICSNEGTTDLFSLLGGADTGGVWSPAMTSTTGVFDPLVDADGTYTYTLTNSCGTFTNQIVVTVVLAPNSGSDNILTICVADDSIDLFTLLGADAQSGGVWSPALDSGTGVFDPLVDASNTYTYTITAVSPCPTDATAEIVVTVNDTPAIIVLESDPEFCLVNNPTVGDLSTSIRPTGTVNWYADAALTIPVLLTDDLVDGEDYYATQTTSGCESSIAVQINVTVSNAPTPTLEDTTLDYCINDNPTISTLSDNIIEHDNNLDNLRWYDAATGGSVISNTSLLTNTSYYVALVDQASGCESSERLEIIPDLTACGKLILPDGFSPNGDGTNDTFDVDNIAILYPDFEIEIYNRNGNVVYKGKANTPKFDGTSNQGRIISKGDLPVGVYFYIFNYNDGENKPEQGSLYLSR